MAAVPAVIDLEHAPAPPRPRPRVLLVGTVLASVAVGMTFAGMISYYLARRAAVIADGDTWVPEGVTLALTPANMGLITLVMSAVTMLWAMYAIGNDDRRNTYLALVISIVLAGAYVNEMGFYFSQMNLEVSQPFGVLVYSIVGGHLAITGAAVVFAVVMAFRTFGGEYSGRDREGIVAATIFWNVSVAVYAVIWLAIFVTK